MINKMKYCKNCRKAYEDNINFCPMCGERLVSENEYNDFLDYIKLREEKQSIDRLEQEVKDLKYKTISTRVNNFPNLNFVESNEAFLKLHEFKEYVKNLYVEKDKVTKAKDELKLLQKQLDLFSLKFYDPKDLKKELNEFVDAAIEIVSIINKTKYSRKEIGAGNYTATEFKLGVIDKINALLKGGKFTYYNLYNKSEKKVYKVKSNIKDTIDDVLLETDNKVETITKFYRAKRIVLHTYILAIYALLYMKGVKPEDPFEANIMWYFGGGNITFSWYIKDYLLPTNIFVSE